VEIDLDARVGEPDARSRNVDYVVPAEPVEAVPLDPVTVTDVDIQQQSIRFQVDQVGVPVLVRVSYFPTWKVEGAEGPFRAGPNQMVVVPTSNEVVLTYSKTALDWFFYSLTLIGIGLCFYWRRRGDVVYAGERPSWGRSAAGPGPSPDTADADGDRTPVSIPVPDLPEREQAGADPLVPGVPDR